MPNMQQHKTEMKTLDGKFRATCFDEVACGYTEEEAINEAKRCLGCKHKPCMDGCPVNVRIPEFIAAVADGDFEKGYQIIKSTNSLPAVCGRVCPQETQCEGKCVRGIKGEPVAIGRLERFCADYHLQNVKSTQAVQIPADAPRVAIIGSGPASLTCAGELARRGYKAVIFEAFHTAGGVLTYGIPEFRLPKNIVKNEIAELENLGVEIRLDMVIGRILSISELFDDGFSAVFIGTGAGLPMFMHIPGESCPGVYSANEFLTRINLMKAYREEYATPVKKMKNAVIVGGGNVAMDAARCAKRMGAENVSIVYRRGEEEMPARREEVEHAKEEGIEFKFLTNPTRINADENGCAKSISCVKMELGEPDASGRRRPVEIPDSEFEIDADAVIMSIGTSPNPLIRMTTPGLETNKKGCLLTSDGVTTTCDGVFAGGDAVTGAATVILAMGAGRQAAQKIDEYIKSKK